MPDPTPPSGKALGYYRAQQLELARAMGLTWSEWLTHRRSVAAAEAEARRLLARQLAELHHQVHDGVDINRVARRLEVLATDIRERAEMAPRPSAAPRA